MEFYDLIFCYHIIFFFSLVCRCGHVIPQTMVDDEFFRLSSLFIRLTILYYKIFFGCILVRFYGILSAFHKMVFKKFSYICFDEQQIPYRNSFIWQIQVVKFFFTFLHHSNCSWICAFSLRLALFFSAWEFLLPSFFFLHSFGSSFFFRKSQFYFPVSLGLFFFYHISTRESTVRYETRKQKYIRLS